MTMAVTNRTSKGKEVKTFTHERLQYCNPDFCTITAAGNRVAVLCQDDWDSENNRVLKFELNYKGKQVI